MGNPRQKVAVIIPAYNEEARISAVLDAIGKAELVDQTVVVSDGSNDSTGSVASAYEWVHTIRLEQNQGKAAAMCVGARHTDADILLFLDADLIGLQPEHVDSLIRPMLREEADMTIGVFKSGRGATDLAQILAPNISGQRALRRSEFLSIPDIHTLRSGVEVALTRYYRALGMTTLTVTLTGVTHAMKEEKIGFVRGFAARLKMYFEIVWTLANLHSLLRAARMAKAAVKASVGRP